uniref:Eukaryotic translation initiation factor 3 subunit L n=1 Tax=Trichuris muris TaxID=70415 RepID=A0A5S6QWP9_TRIMR
MTATMQQDQFSSVPDEVCIFLRQLKRSLREQNAQEILTLYEYGFTDLTERFHGEAALPDENTVINVTASDPSNVYDSIFVMLYKELYYRYVYAKNYRATSLEYRIASYYNYMNFFDTILGAEEPLRFNLPDQWLWDIVDEFVYQFHAFCQYREMVDSTKGDDKGKEEFRKCDSQVWSFYNVVDVLYALVEKASIEQQLAAIKNREPFKPDTRSEFFKHPLYYKLAYFSLISLLRLHTQLGEYHQALKMVENIEFTPMSLYNSVPSCQVTLHFYVGFCHLMKRQYQHATRLFVDSLLYIQRTRPLNNQQAQQKSWQYDLVGRINDQMYQLLAICVALQPQRIEESIQSELYKQVSDRFSRMQRGELKDHELAFQAGCPRFFNPVSSSQESDKNLSQEAVALQISVFKDEICQQSLIPILRGCLKLYSTIKLSKLSSFMDNKERELTNALLCYKHKMYNPEKGSNSDDDSSVDLDFYINLDMIYIADTTVARRYGEYFIRHIQQLIELNRNLPKISGKSFKDRYAELRESRR